MYGHYSDIFVKKEQFYFNHTHMYLLMGLNSTFIGQIVYVFVTYFISGLGIN